MRVLFGGQGEGATLRSETFAGECMVEVNTRSVSRESNGSSDPESVETDPNGLPKTKRKL